MKPWYFADFETDTTQTDSTFVWAWGLASTLNDDFDWGTSIHSFLLQLQKLPDKSIVWFHNLKFDGQFIMEYCLTRSYEAEDGSMIEWNYGKNPWCIESLISSMGQWYSIIMHFPDKTISIQNSLLKIPMKISKIAENLKLRTLKGEIDYTLYREEYAESLTDSDYDYLKNDVLILKQAMMLLFYGKGLDGMTIGSDCLKEFREICKGNYRKFFPLLENKADTDIRRAYRGGFTYKKPLVYDVGAGQVYDINSMYPSVMHSSSKNYYPVGEGEYYLGEYITDVCKPLYVQHICVSLQVKENKPPFLQSRNSYRGKGEFIECGKDIDLWLTSVDMDTMFNCYDIYDINYIEGYKFDCAKGLFDVYIDKWYEVKEQAAISEDAVEKFISKLFLNNLYGKFGMNPISPTKEPFYVENGKLVYKTLDNERDSEYVPVACFVTAYARRKLITAIIDNWERFLYCDTDSIHLSGLEVGEALEIHRTKLGAWDNEMTFTKARYIRQKTYGELDRKTGKWVWKCAGCPDNLKAQITLDTFREGLCLEGKLVAKRVIGGVKLIETTFQIKEGT